MFHSIRSKLVVAVVIMAVLLGTLIYVSSARLNELETTLAELQDLQEFKSHVLIPQKDMNEFLAKMEQTVLLVELGEPELAQATYDGSVDAEVDISNEFAFLEENGSDELLASAEQTHRDWEVAVEYLKLHAEAVAAEAGVQLVRPTIALAGGDEVTDEGEMVKYVDGHTTEAIESAQAEYGSMSVSELEALAEDPETSPVEIADEGIDGLEDQTDEVLAAVRADGEESLASTSSTIILGSAIALLAIVVIGAVVTSSVSRPLVMLKDGAEQIAAGDLNHTFENVPNDEVGAVIKSVEKMSGSLRSRISNLEELAGVVMLTGDEIEAAASAIEPKSPHVDTILAKAKTLKELVGQMLRSTKE